MYGRGMGTAIALWHCAWDTSAGYVLCEWAKLRLRQMRLAATRRDWADVRDEVTMLVSTVRGLSQGWKLGNGSR